MKGVLVIIAVAAVAWFGVTQFSQTDHVGYTTPVQACQSVGTPLWDHGGGGIVCLDSEYVRDSLVAGVVLPPTDAYVIAIFWRTSVQGGPRLWYER
jgi:hypothetical protein